jgi:hypothetical protein
MHIFLSAMGAMLAARILIYLVPMRHATEVFDRLARRWPARVRNTPPLRQITKRVSQAGSWSPWASCLATALAGKFILQRWGVECQMRIGVSRKDFLGRNGFRAHAWLECPENIVIGQSPAQAGEYVPLPPLKRFFA